MSEVSGLGPHEMVGAVAEVAVVSEAGARDFIAGEATGGGEAARGGEAAGGETPGGGCAEGEMADVEEETSDGCCRGPKS